MKLYSWAPAPNPRRVRMFLAEKGIEVPVEEVGAADGPKLSDTYLALGPHRLVPMLELDDGTLIGEAAAICRYFECLQPEPALMGRTPAEQATIDMWERKAEMEGGQATGEHLRNRAKPFADRALPGFARPVPQIPALVERGKLRFEVFCEKFNDRLGTVPFVAGEAFSIADITAFCVLDFANTIRLAEIDAYPNLARWYAEIGARDSAKA